MSLCHVLKQVAPEGITRRLVAATFEIEIEGKRVEWQEREALRFVDEKSGLEAQVEAASDRPYRATSLKISLENRSARPSPPITAIRPLVLKLSEATEARIRTAGGGLAYGIYPSPAYEERTWLARSEAGEPVVIESGPDGRSSNKDLPFLMAGVADAGLIVALEWSGLWRQTAFYGPMLRIVAEIPVGGIVLEPGARLDLPATHVVFFEGDLDCGGNALRRYIYDRITPPLEGRKPLPPVSYDHWFGVGGDVDVGFMKAQVGRCAEIGVEYFVLDAGWYAGCGPEGDFSLGLGNWTRVDLRKFPEGLEPLAEYVRSKGMKFGLWFEVERAHRGSDLVREHPQWFLDVGGEDLHLDLSRREVQDFVIDLVGGWIERLDLGWSRWDYNIGPKAFWERHDPTGKLMFRYVEGLYRVLDTLIQQHPSWLVECCASGGRRIDLGTLRRACTVWFSDHTDDSHICRYMQTGANRFLPGNYPNSAVPTAKGAGDHGLSDFDFISRMCGAFSVDGDVASWSAGLTKRAGRSIEVYKSFRHLLVQNFYPLTPHPKRPDEWEVVEFASREGSEAAVLAFRAYGGPESLTIPLKGLREGLTYSVTDPLDEEPPCRATGEALLRDGVELSLRPHDALIRLVQKV